MWKRLVLVLLPLLLAGCSVPVTGLTGNTQGALQVTSNETMKVFLDDNHVGETPFYDERLKSGSYTLKLVPTKGEEQSRSWQTKLSIYKRALTVVNYDLQISKEQSSSEILKLEPLSNVKEIKLSISSIPDNVVVKLDDRIKGFSPISLTDLTAGDHVLTLEAPGYLAKTITVKTNLGQHLIIETQLARDAGQILELPIDSPTATESARIATDSATPTPSATPETSSQAGKVVGGVTYGESKPENLTKPYVQILGATPGINWLRVRSTPVGLADNEVARVRVGDYYSFVEDSENGEWRQIEYTTGKKGWVATPYAKLTE